MGIEKSLAYIAVCGVFGVATYARYKINERRFNRRNVAGMEEFESYSHAVSAKFLEGVISFVAGITQLITIIFWAILFSGALDHAH